MSSWRHRLPRRSELAGLEDVTDEVVSVAVPEPFYAVGEWYSDFSQTSDSDVRDLLARADARRWPGGAGAQ